MKCKITKVEIIPIQIELNEPFIISIGPLTHASITVVKIHTNQGLYGTGECCPFRTIHTESQSGSVEQGQTIAKLLIDQDPTQIARITKIMNTALPHHASIKAAFDMAFYDLNAKLVDQPLYQYLNGDSHKVITTDMTISLMDKDIMMAKAAQYRDQGFPMLKVKLGDPDSLNDVDRIRGIREVLGVDFPLCLDANQGWSYDAAVVALTEMQHMNISHCEAPIFSGNHEELKKIRDLELVPIMGDESVFSPEDAYQMLHKGCIDLVNIKLGKAGGIHQAMKIAAIAEAADVHCQVGCFSETRLGISALVHFSMAWAHIIHHDLDAPLMQSEDPIIGGLTYHDDWHVTVSDKPGIGAQYDELFLKKFDFISIA